MREHFAELGDIGRRNQDSIVKIVGDAIHALFSLPEDGLRAAIEIQQSIPGFSHRYHPGDITIRLGLHSGSSIALTFNGRLDYYGEAVKLATGLEGRGDAEDITISVSFCEDPTVSTILQTHEPMHRLANMKGFDNPITIALINLQATHDRKY